MLHMANKGNSSGNYLQYIQIVILSINIICVDHYSRFNLFTHVMGRCVSTWVSTCNVRIRTYNVSGDEMGIQMTYSYHENIVMMILKIVNI